MTSFRQPKTLLCFKVRVRVRVRAGVSGNMFSVKRIFEHGSRYGQTFTENHRTELIAGYINYAVMLDLLL